MESILIATRSRRGDGRALAVVKRRGRACVCTLAAVVLLRLLLLRLLLLGGVGALLREKA